MQSKGAEIMAGKIGPRGGQVPSQWRRDPLGSLRDEMEDLFSNFWEGRRAPWSNEMVPSADLSETAEAIHVQLDVPGINPDQLDIQLQDQILTVRGERKEEKEEKGKTFHRIERHAGNFTRAFQLPCAVAEDRVVAEYRDGVLQITLPKSPQARQRKISVQPGKNNG
jgi:HSP20 family protein